MPNDLFMLSLSRTAVPSAGAYFAAIGAFAHATMLARLGYIGARLDPAASTPLMMRALRMQPA
jgi:hypothetical protein